MRNPKNSKYPIKNVVPPIETSPKMKSRTSKRAEAKGRKERQPPPARERNSAFSSLRADDGPLSLLRLFPASEAFCTRRFFPLSLSLSLSSSTRVPLVDVDVEQRLRHLIIRPRRWQACADVLPSHSSHLERAPGRMREREREKTNARSDTRGKKRERRMWSARASARRLLFRCRSTCVPHRARIHVKFEFRAVFSRGKRWGGGGHRLVHAFLARWVGARELIRECLSIFSLRLFARWILELMIDVFCRDVLRGIT